MKKYQKIHIWEFPLTRTFIELPSEFRTKMFRTVVTQTGSERKFLDYLNVKSERYAIRRNHSRRNLYSWIRGTKFDRGTAKKIGVPLWVLIECAKMISKDKALGNPVMRQIERNILSYRSWGNSTPITKPKLPLLLTPELVSVIFHFMGDGHIGGGGVSSSYRQMNKGGLNNFLTKLRNSFGNFTYSKREFADGRLNVPNIVTEFYKKYFALPNTDTFTAYIPEHIMQLDRECLLAGLASFIIDEGHVWEVITIYSKNRALLEGVRDIGIKCGYLCHPIREKYAYGKFDCYRFSISSKSYRSLIRDLKRLARRFPTCDLAHKMERLIRQIE